MNIFRKIIETDHLLLPFLFPFLLPSLLRRPLRRYFSESTTRKRRVGHGRLFELTVRTEFNKPASIEKWANEQSCCSLIEPTLTAVTHFPSIHYSSRTLTKVQSRFLPLVPYNIHSTRFTRFTKKSDQSRNRLLPFFSIRVRP